MGAYPIEGTTVRFYTSQPFTSISGTIVTPDIVTFSYTTPLNTTPTVYTYTNGNTPPDPNYKIVLDSTGNFHIDLSTAGAPGQWVYEWEGQPGVSGLDTTKTSAIFQGYISISNSNF